MKRYTPSVKNNNELKQEVVNELKALVYRLEKGRHGALDGDSVADVLSELKEQMSALENCIGTGEENIGVLAKDALAQVKPNGAAYALVRSCIQMGNMGELSFIQI